jgi:hypothetical protein
MFLPCLYFPEDIADGADMYVGGTCKVSQQMLLVIHQGLLFTQPLITHC